ncbi:hypothetical protein P8935_04805 [Telmatobacter sp. DSM 110680]|uniref:DUF928 domain-containing protein n=1 Tax=Telmatobacter sp. DSM 110680 TaxID=3036704 RepID=A0AAU7DLX6_9BACT
MGKLKHKRLYILPAILILAVAFMFVYHWQSSRRAQLYRLPRRSQPLAPQGVAEQLMLQGKFSSDIPAEQRQIVAAELQASEPAGLNRSVETAAQPEPGEQHIAITQPIGTTVEDTQPTFTWDANVDGWSYRVRVVDQSTHLAVITSPVVDEAMWRISTPLPRGHNYVWSVDAIPVGIRTTATTVTSQPARFAVLSDEGEQVIQNAKAHNASHLLLGSLYTHYEMWRDAVLEYRQMVDEVPDSPEAIKLLRNAEVRASSKISADSAP